MLCFSGEGLKRGSSSSTRSGSRKSRGYSIGLGRSQSGGVSEEAEDVLLPNSRLRLIYFISNRLGLGWHRAPCHCQTAVDKHHIRDGGGMRESISRIYSYLFSCEIERFQSCIGGCWEILRPQTAVCCITLKILHFEQKGTLFEIGFQWWHGNSRWSKPTRCSSICSALPVKKKRGGGGDADVK